MDVGRISNHVRMRSGTWSVDLVWFSDVYCAFACVVVDFVYSSDAFENVEAITDDAS